MSHRSCIQAQPRQFTFIQTGTKTCYVDLQLKILAPPAGVVSCTLANSRVYPHILQATTTKFPYGRDFRIRQRSQSWHRKLERDRRSIARPSASLSPQTLTAATNFATFLTVTLPPLAVISAGINLQDAAAGVFTVVASVVWVGFLNELARRNFVERKLSRKLVHISSGLLFMLTWIFYSSSPTAPLCACIAPLINCIRLAFLGLGFVQDAAMVRSITREGNVDELLRGPLYYSLTLLLVSLFCWRSSPVGVAALAMMCGGDGVADIVGRRWGSAKLPWNPEKSWAGSLSMFTLGASLTLLFVNLFCTCGFFPCPFWSLEAVGRVLLVAAGATLVESLPVSARLDDNFTVPLTAGLLATLLL